MLFLKELFLVRFVPGTGRGVYTCEWVYLRGSEVSELELQAFVSREVNLGPP